MRKFNRIVDEYLSFDTDSDIDSEDSINYSIVCNKDINADISNKNEGVYNRFRNLFRACFV